MKWNKINKWKAKIMRKILHLNETKGRLKRKQSKKNKVKKTDESKRYAEKDLQIEKYRRNLLISCRKGKQHPF